MHDKSDPELHTFFQKFNQLWNAGLNAHLDLDCHAGQAWVGLRVQLGQEPGPLHQQLYPNFKPDKFKESPSRHRRRVRRAADRQEKAEKANCEENIIVDTEAEVSHHEEQKNDIEAARTQTSNLSADREEQSNLKDREETDELPYYFLCDVCLKSFRTRKLDFEANGFTFTCEVCSLLWKDEEAFEEHIKQNHTNHTCV